jgi:hypothetical protein
MKYPLFLVGFILLVHTAFSQVVTNPVADFLLRHTDANTGELFPGESWNGFSDCQPPGGYLLRFEAPIGPNGSPVVCIGASILADRRNSVWSAYIRVGNKGYTFAGDVGFGPNPKFYLQKSKINGTPELAEVSADKTSIGVATYYIDRNGSIQQGDLGGIDRDQDKEYDDPKFEDKEMNELERKFGLSKKFTPKIEKILLGEYLKSPLTKWRPSDATLSVESQSADPSEKPAVLQDTLDKATAAALLRRNLGVKQ